MASDLGVLILSLSVWYELQTSLARAEGQSLMNPTEQPYLQRAKMQCYGS